MIFVVLIPEEHATEAQAGLGDVRWVPYSHRKMPGVEFRDVQGEFGVLSSSLRFYVAVEFRFCVRGWR